MAFDRSNLEPAERDPAALRRTAFILLMIAILGGVMVTWAYLVKTEDKPDRPPFLGRLNRNFAAIDQNKKATDLSQLDGNVWLATTLVLSDAKASEDALLVMQDVEKAFPPDEVGRLVVFTLDPERDRPEKLKEFAASRGLDGDRWLFLAAGEKEIRGYAKDHLKLGFVTKEKDKNPPAIKAPSVLSIIDGNRHIRGRFDFRYARQVEESAKKLLAEEPELAEKFEEDFGRRPEEFTDEQQELKDRLFRYLELILAEDVEEDGSEKSS